MKIKTKILLSFLAVIVFLSVSISLLGGHAAQKYIIGNIQDQVNNHLTTVRVVYQKQLKKIEMAFVLANPEIDFESFRKAVGLDYVYYVPAEESGALESEIAVAALRQNRAIGGNRLIQKEELTLMGVALYEKAVIEIRPTPKARATDRKVLETAMAVEYARPFHDAKGNPAGVFYGGKIINKNYDFVDEISNAVFAGELYESKPLGTVTIFLDDVRIATNVLDSEGRRAIGTRVSAMVYDKVMARGEIWQDRAFVVTDWYLTAYEPLRDIRGRIVGILYVGILEKPFVDLRGNLLLAFLLIVLLGVFSAAVLSMVLAAAISKPVTEMRDVIYKVSHGDLECRLKNHVPIAELSELSLSFNAMTEKLQEREQGLKVANEKLEALNKSYLNMIGFVSHELKGILGSIVMNVYSVRDGYLGELNPNQKKAIDAAAKSLDHFEEMVKNYLDLSRIEKGQLEIKCAEVRFAEEIVRPTVEHFEQEWKQKDMRVKSGIAPDLRILADRNLLLIACNNLMGNAVKYGTAGGLIEIGCRRVGNLAEVSFYNDGNPIPQGQSDGLFKRFSRLPGSEKVKGTGLGLFIVKEIVEKHGGTVRVESRPGGNAFVFTLPQP